MSEDGRVSAGSPAEPWRGAGPSLHPAGQTLRGSGQTLRVALFGGTFDPPHRGHLAIARAAADRFVLDQVLFTPAGRQPLKAAHTSAPYADRLAMVERLCTGDARFIACALDAPHPGGEANYTVDTLTELAAALGATAHLFAIAGADSFRSLAHWREPQRLLALAEWIVVSRPGFPLAGDLAPVGLELDAADRARIHPLDAVHDPVSATQLRERLAAGTPCDDLLPAPVAAYIRERGLYRTWPEHA